ncbi:MAG: orotidine-5'-phosphate decarboxylase [Candidatus Saccharimonadales bacterium]
MTFLEKLDMAISKNNSLVCIGLDPDVDKMPASIRQHDQSLFEFNKAIISATADLVCAYKPNTAFYERHGADGINELYLTCRYIENKYPDIPIILDFKRGDIGNTNKYYAEFAFDYLAVDAVTIQPYQGRTAVQPFLDFKEKGIIVICRTSNQGAGEFQDLDIDGSKLYIQVAKRVINKWNDNKNCLLVVGATKPRELAELRRSLYDNTVFLVPGIGAQGGDIGLTLNSGLNSNNRGLIISVSRSIIYAGDNDNFQAAARLETLRLNDQINKYRSNNHG